MWLWFKKHQYIKTGANIAARKHQAMQLGEQRRQLRCLSSFQGLLEAKPLKKYASQGSSILVNTTSSRHFQRITTSLPACHIGTKTIRRLRIGRKGVFVDLQIPSSQRRQYFNTHNFFSKFVIDNAWTQNYSPVSYLPVSN